MARKQKLLSQSTGHLRVVEQGAKYKVEFTATDGLPELQKTPPAYLDKVAKAEYRRIIGPIGKLPLRNLDRSELELYCTWYSIYKDASIQLNEEQSKRRKNIAKINNAIKTIDKATRTIEGLASDLGLSVNSRLQMNMSQADKEEHQSLRDKFRIS